MINVFKMTVLDSIPHTNGLGTPDEAIFLEIQKFWALADRPIEQINSGAFVVFPAKLSVPILVQGVSSPRVSFDTPSPIVTRIFFLEKMRVMRKQC